MTILKKIDMAVDGMFAKQTDWPIVHSSMKPNSSVLFYGTDNNNDYEINKARLPLDWIYNSLPVTYNFNSNGLRMEKNIEQVDSNYFIAFGCSHTVGVGVALENTWPYLLSKELNIDYINSAVSGSSIKLNAINFFNMLDQVGTLPKIVAFAWPSSVRYTWYSQGQFLFYLPRYTTDKKEFKLQTQAYNDMLMTDVLTSEAVFYRNMIKTTCKKLGIMYCETSFDYRCEFVKNLGIQLANTDSGPHVLNNMDLGFINNQFARDIRDMSGGNLFGHVGIGLHKNAQKILINQLA